MSVQESALPRQGIEGLYAEHHGWLRGWLRGWAMPSTPPTWRTTPTFAS